MRVAKANRVERACWLDGRIISACFPTIKYTSRTWCRQRAWSRFLGRPREPTAGEEARYPKTKSRCPLPGKQWWRTARLEFGRFTQIGPKAARSWIGIEKGAAPKPGKSLPGRFLTRCMGPSREFVKFVSPRLSTKKADAPNGD